MYEVGHKLLECKARDEIREDCRVIFTNVTLANNGWIIIYRRYLNGETLEHRCAYIAFDGPIEWDNIFWNDPKAKDRALEWPL